MNSGVAVEKEGEGRQKERSLEQEIWGDSEHDVNF